MIRMYISIKELGYKSKLKTATKIVELTVKEEKFSLKLKLY